MKNKEIKNVNHISWIVIILSIIVLYFTYFFFYIPQQESLLQERGFRILKEYGNNMYGKYAYYQQHLENYGGYYAIRSILESDSIKEEGKNSKKETKQMKDAKPTKELLDLLEVIKSLDPAIRTEAVPDTSKNILPHFSNDRNYLNFPRSKAVNPVKPQIIGNLQQQLNMGNYFLEKDIVYQVPIRKLMDGLKLDGLLDNIILFDESMVMYNSKLDDVHDITNPKALRDSVRNHQGGVLETIRIRGTKHRLMILPIDFAGKQVYLAGVIPDKAFKKKTRTINSQLLIVISGILLLVLVSIPVLKIILINHQERLSLSDAYGSVLSVILSTGLLVLITISILKYQLTDRNLKQDRIEHLSNTLYHHVYTDIHSIIKLYKGIVMPENKDVTGFPSFVSKQFRSGKKFTQIPDSLLGIPVPINEIILIDSTGFVSKAVTQTAFSEAIPVDLSQRGYFKNVMDTNKSWLMHTDRQRFYIESIKSYNTGYQEAAISFRLKNPIDENAPVLAITSAIPSLYNQILPKDIRFLVINERGQVLFHSMQSKNLHENFLAECEFDPRLNSAIKLREEETMKVTYNEKEWLAKILPIEDTPLFHITLLADDQIENRNARIFLFTFYFLFLTLICTGIGILIMRWSQPRRDFLQTRTWSLTWLLFQTENYLRYKALSIIMGTIILLQVFGVIYVEKPVSMLIYQLIFVSYSGFVALALLGRNRTISGKLAWKSLLTEILILAIVGFLILLLLWKFNPGTIILLPLTALVLLTVVVFLVAGEPFADLPKTWSQFKKLPLFPFNTSKIKRSGSMSETDHHQADPKTIKKVYTVFMLLWLASLSVVPVIQYYYTIQNQEVLINSREEMQDIAYQNLVLSSTLKDMKEASWFKRIQGNGIDGMKVLLKDSIVHQTNLQKLSDTDAIYSKLPDPLTTGNYLMTYLKNESPHYTWQSDPTRLNYSYAGFDGSVQVTSPDDNSMNSFNWFMYLLTSILLVSLLIWKLYQYMSENILNTNPAIRIIPETHSLKTLVHDKHIKRILLDSYDGEYCLEATKQLIGSSSNDHNTRKQHLEMIKADHLISPEFDMAALLTGEEKIIWISDLDQCIQQIKKHDLILSGLMKLNQSAEGKVIIVRPFELDFINEYYDDYMDENEIEKEEKALIYTWEKSWKSIFKDFNKYSGHFVPDDLKAPEPLIIGKGQLTTADDGKTKPLESSGNSLLNQSILEKQSISNREGHKRIEEHILDMEYKMEPRYFHIWNNLSNIEKLILCDLAVDGLLNLKNKHLIKRLVIKGLIIPEPYPKLYAESFKYFINNSISPEEFKRLESQLSRKGDWHRMRYLILFILIMLAAFVFISQGISIEKVIGIFAGLLAMLSGFMRLFDNNVFRQSTK